MNNYQKAMKKLSFDPHFSEKTIHLLNAYADTLPQEKAHKPLRTYGRIALIAATLTVMLTTAVFAAVHLLTPSEVAAYFGDTALAAAFESEDAVIINEEKVAGEYTIALNGIVNGADVREYVENEESSYIVLSVRYTDGRTITPGETRESDPICHFTASPYVHGFAPSAVNLFTLESRAHKGVVGNVLYILLETDKLGQFGDTPVYLGVVESDTMSHIINDEECPFTLAENGEIVQKEQFDAAMACAVFELSL